MAGKSLFPHQVNLQLSRTQFGLVDGAAKKLGVSRAEIVRECVEAAGKTVVAAIRLRVEAEKRAAKEAARAAKAAKPRKAAASAAVKAADALAKTTEPPGATRKRGLPRARTQPLIAGQDRVPADVASDD